MRISVTDDQMIDITEPQEVEVLIREDHKTLWINVDGVCRLRVSHISKLQIDDLSLRQLKEGKE